jgi:hypothetical protein
VKDAGQCAVSSKFDKDSSARQRGAIIQIRFVTHSPRASLTKSRGSDIDEFASSSMMLYLGVFGGRMQQ